MRYGVELARAGFYAGTPGYAQVVTGGVAVDLVVIAVLFVALIVAGTAVFGYRERAR
jgi:ABC-2 type transport system permease protein